MRGFKVGAKPKAPRSIKSGTIQGPGTGTSDDVKATVAEGSYVMPADSTAQIGAEQLQGMGAPVDVNLSNGEQLMSPEQVHAVGVQTLDAMKNATHVPAAQQQGVKGFQPRGNEQGKPELFFADGGAVQEFSDSVGGYWSSDNAQFEAGSPSTMQRVGRALNPVTSLGSAIGAMHDAAGQGDVAGMGLAAAQAIPVFGAVRAVAPTLKTAAGFVPSAGKTAAATAGSAAFGAAADQYTPSEQSFADGGPVFGGVDPDELGRGNTPQRNVIPRPSPIYVDTQGTATRALPSQSRALVPAGPVTGTDVATTRQPSPTGAAPDAEAPKASARPEPDYRARAETMGRAKADTAAYEAHRAAQDARFEAAKNQPAAPEKTPGRVRSAVNGTAGKGFAALSFIPALAESAAEDSTARYAKRFGMDEPTGDGSAGDILKFAALRGLGFASDLGNNLTMGLAGKLFRDNQGEQAPGTAAAAPRQAPASAAPAQVAPAAQQAAPSEAVPAAQDSGYQQTGIKDIVGKKDENGQYSFTNESSAVAGATGQLRGDTPTAGGQPAGRGSPVGAPGAMSAPDGARVLAAGSNYQTPAQEFAALGSTANLGNGDGDFSQMQAGDSALALERFERANQEREKMIQASRRGEIGEGGGRVTVVGSNDAMERARARREQDMADLTPNQLRTTARLQESSERNATDLARERIQQEGADGRAAITEAGANQRFAQSNALDQQRTAAEVEGMSFANRSAQRIEKLYEQYDKAAPEDRAAIAEQLRVLAGKDKPDQYGTVSLGTEIDPVTGMVTNRGDAVFNRANGQIIGQSTALPPIEQNPQALAIKNNQNLSRDERAKQLRALGYQ